MSKIFSTSLKVCRLHRLEAWYLWIAIGDHSTGLACICAICCYQRRLPRLASRVLGLRPKTVECWNSLGL